MTTDLDLGQLRAEEALRRAVRLTDGERRAYLRSRGWRKTLSYGRECWGRGDGRPSRTIDGATVDQYFLDLSEEQWMPS